MDIVNYASKIDGLALFRLWTGELGQLWPIEKSKLLTHVETGGTPGCFVAKQGEQLLGFISTKLGLKGSIQLIIVKSDYQRQGIGTRLLHKALEYLRQQGITEIQLGAGANPYFWPGVPDNLPTAHNFFRKNGWEFSEESVDMVGDLKTYATPADLLDRPEKLGIKFVLADKGQSKDILSFESENFPHWKVFFENALAGKSDEDILLAMNNSHKITGSVLVGEKSIIWNKILGHKVGTLGALGVKESARGQGIGLALAARATEILRDKGLAQSYLGWTWLIDWYGRLGYQVWRTYHMSYKR